MNGTQRETPGSGFGLNDEDLDVVLGRFQNWAATRQAKAGENAPAGVRLPREAREVSYEEALRASSYSGPKDFSSVDPSLLEADADKVSNEDSERIDSYSPPVRPVGGPACELKFKQKPETPFAETLRAVAMNPLSAWPTAATTEQPTAVSSAPPRREVIGVAMAPIPEPHNTDHRPPESQESASVAPGLGVAQTKPAAARSRRRQQRPQPAFRDVLKSTAALVAATQPGPAPPERGKSTSLTLRVSDPEQARIQARASQANLSVSAYLRQCALGVEELREQVELALENLHEQQERVASPPSISAIPGILGHFAMQCLRRIRGTSEDYTVISIR